MMYHNIARKIRRDDAISPVIGTILMVAATVIIAGAVYAAVNAYNGKSAKPAPDAAFKATAVDTGAAPNGLEDTIKVTYISGTTSAATVTIKNADGTTAMQDGADADTLPNDAPCTTTLSAAGQFFACKPQSAGTYYAVVSIGDQTLLDQTMTVKE